MNDWVLYYYILTHNSFLFYFECSIISNVFNLIRNITQTFGPSLRWHVLFILKVTSYQHRIRTNEVNQFYIWAWNWLRNTARKGLMWKYVILPQRLALVFVLNLVSILQVPSAYEGEGGRRYRMTVKAVFVYLCSMLSKNYSSGNIKNNIKA